MNLQLIQFIQNLAAIHSQSPKTMTPADVLTLMKSKREIETTTSDNEKMEDIEEEIQLPDPSQYPKISSIHLYHLQYRFSLICMLNQRLGLLLQNMEMDLVDEWWSLAYKLKTIRSLIFTSTKLDLIRIYNQREFSPQYTFGTYQVTIDRRLAQDSSKFEN